MNKFELFVNDKTALAGFELGQEMYKMQIQKKVNLSSDIYITIPKKVRRISSSFIQGFSKEMIQELGYDGFKKTVHILCSTPGIVDCFYTNLM